MACMCGDTHCSSCGPAQGNSRCPICNAWLDDCCPHFGEDGQLLPEFEAEAAAREETQRMADDAYAADLAAEADLAMDYLKENER